MAITTKIHTRIFISRFYDVGTHTETTEIHFVADSSNQEYGVVVYLCSKLNSDVKVSFVLGKSRLAPIKEKSLTIPKLELQAALIAVRIKEKLVKEANVQVSKLYFWSDSKTVLKFIRNENTRFPTYVMHRINEIRSSSDISYCHFVPGKLNISDNCTRPTTFENIAKDNRYLNGPPFLYESLESVLKFDDIKEEEKDQVENNQINTNQPTKVTSAFPWERYTSFTRFIRRRALSESGNPKPKVVKN